jgi:hypothetical protein
MVGWMATNSSCKAQGKQPLLAAVQRVWREGTQPLPTVTRVTNQYDTKQVKYREDTDLMWKTSPKRKKKPQTSVSNNITIFSGGYRSKEIYNELNFCGRQSNSIL